MRPRHAKKPPPPPLSNSHDSALLPKTRVSGQRLNTDLIVLTTHGYTGLKHVLLGSTAERVVRHAACPVLTVRELIRKTL